MVTNTVASDGPVQGLPHNAVMLCVDEGGGERGEGGGVTLVYLGLKVSIQLHRELIPLVSDFPSPQS